MKKKLIMLLILLLFISCDGSFDLGNPFGYDDKKLENGCLVNEDCDSKSCNIEKKSCNPNPCDGITCSGHGKCEVKDGKAECLCGTNKDKTIQYFQDGKTNCKSICDTTVCGHEGVCRSQEKNIAICECKTIDDIFYYNDNGQCVSACDNVNCGHGSCKSSNKDNQYCDCNDGYQDNDNDLVCKQSCNNVIVNNCGEHGSCDDSTGIAECSCDWGYYSKNYSCISPCDNVNCSNIENSHCIANSATEYECICDNTYKKSSDNLKCVATCSTENVCSQELGEVACIIDPEDEDKIKCSCDTGYFQDSDNNCINPCNSYSCDDGYSCIANSLTDIRCENPCSDIDCGNGECIYAINGQNGFDTFCRCDNGYQDNDNNLVCEKSCNYKEDGVQICTGDNRFTGICNDSDGKVKCKCTKYFEGDLCENSYFITTWNVSDDKRITIPTNPAYHTYNYDVDCDGDGDWEFENQEGDVTCTYETEGIYSVAIKGDFPQIYFNNCGFCCKSSFASCPDNGCTCDNVSGVPISPTQFRSCEYDPWVPNLCYKEDDCVCISNADKIISVEQWGTINLKSMNRAFSGAKFFSVRATDSPNLTEVEDMSYLFYQVFNFNSDLSSWNVSNIKNMSNLFTRTKFNQPLNSWDVSNVTDMSSLFKYCSEFNQPLNNWNVSNVINMESMFNGDSKFNQDISNWNVSNVINMSNMFQDGIFNQSLNNWDVSSVTDMTKMFSSNSKFNQPLSDWDVSRVTNMEAIFQGTIFNQPLNNWDVSSVTDMSSMFSGSQFNQNLSSWNLSNVTDMSNMFSFSPFNQDLSSWNVSSVTDMEGMFQNNSIFNQDLSDWDVSSVTNMKIMFRDSIYNRDLSSWNVSSVTDMSGMFQNNSIFNQDLSSWDVSSVINMNLIFYGAASFNQDLTSWEVEQVINCSDFENNASWPEDMEPNFTSCNPN